MDTTMLAVFGTGLTAIGTAVALFVALWRVQGSRFDLLERHIDKRFEGVDKRFEGVDKQFEAADKRWAERFEMAERANRERFEMAEKASRERFEMAENASRERAEQWTERFEMAEKASRERSEAMDARWTERLDAMDARWAERLETVERQNQATHAAVCALNGRFDDLYRHLLGAGAPPAQPGPAAG